MPDSRIQIRLSAPLFAAAHRRAERAGWSSTSAWLRHLLANWEGPLMPPARLPARQLSVRLDASLRARLEQLAHQAGVSLSRAFSLLVDYELQRDPHAR